MLGTALQISASGMAAQKARLDVIAANLANVDTPGYHRKTVQFAEELKAAAQKLPFTTGGSSAIGGVKITGLTEDTTPVRIMAETGLQSSNVEVVTEMVDMMAAVRS